MDALPVEERTGLPYASKVTAKNKAGTTVPVMHACGHDIHMTSFIGAADLLARSKSRWRGTLLLIAQPDEEMDDGAAAMLKDGLLTRFPRPQFAVAFHDAPFLPAGVVGATSGPAYASVDSVDITIHGRGGHGSTPQYTVDPIVIAARTIEALQTIVAREQDPFDPAVVTVGSIHGGTKHNIIPDEVKLQLTVRTYTEPTRKRILASIARIAKAEAAAAGAPRGARRRRGSGASARGLQRSRADEEADGRLDARVRRGPGRRDQALDGRRRLRRVRNRRRHPVGPFLGSAPWTPSDSRRRRAIRPGCRACTPRSSPPRRSRRSRPEPPP